MDEYFSALFARSPHPERDVPVSQNAEEEEEGEKDVEDLVRWIWNSHRRNGRW